MSNTAKVFLAVGIAFAALFVTCVALVATTDFDELEATQKAREAEEAEEAEAGQAEEVAEQTRASEGLGELTPASLEAAIAKRYRIYGSSTTNDEYSSTTQIAAGDDGEDHIEATMNTYLTEGAAYSTVGQTRTLVTIVHDENDDPKGPRDLAVALGAENVDTVERADIQKRLEDAGWKVRDTSHSADEFDEVAFTDFEAEREDEYASVFLFDYRTAAKEGRAVVADNRVLVISGYENKRRAKRLVRELFE